MRWHCTIAAVALLLMGNGPGALIVPDSPAPNGLRPVIFLGVDGGPGADLDANLDANLDAAQRQAISAHFGLAHAATAEVLGHRLDDPLELRVLPRQRFEARYRNRLVAGASTALESTARGVSTLVFPASYRLDGHPGRQRHLVERYAEATIYAKAESRMAVPAWLRVGLARAVAAAWANDESPLPTPEGNPRFGSGWSGTARDLAWADRAVACLRAEGGRAAIAGYLSALKRGMKPRASYREHFGHRPRDASAFARACVEKSEAVPAPRP